MTTTLNAKITTQDTCREKWNLKKANWRIFQKTCERQIENIHITDDTENAYKDLVEAITEATTAAIPKIKIKIIIRGNPYWNEECTSAIKNRNKARNKMNRTKLLDDCINFKHLKGIAQKIINIAKTNYWQTYCTSLATTTKLGSVWRMARKMSGTPNQTSISTIEVDGQLIEDNFDKVNALAASYAAISSNQNYSTTFLVKKAEMEGEWKGTAEQTSEPTTASSLNKSFTQQEFQNFPPKR